MRFGLALLALMIWGGAVAAQDCARVFDDYVYCDPENRWAATPSDEPGVAQFTSRFGVARIWRSETEARGDALGAFYSDGFEQALDVTNHAPAREGVTVSLTASAPNITFGTPVMATLFEDATGIVVIETIFPNQFNVDAASRVNPLMVNIHGQFVAGVQRRDE